RPPRTPPARQHRRDLALAAAVARGERRLLLRALSHDRQPGRAPGASVSLPRPFLAPSSPATTSIPCPRARRCAADVELAEGAGGAQALDALAIVAEQAAEHLVAVAARLDRGPLRYRQGLAEELDRRRHEVRAGVL